MCHFIQFSPKFSLTYVVSLAVESKIKLLDEQHKEHVSK